MPVPLSSALVDQILFAMEDQESFSVLNLTNRQVEICEDENACGDGSVIPLPTWSSSDGFRMMREFSEGLHNPTVQAELRTVLDSGHGVFRRFKMVLKPRDLLYRQWLRFKRKFMEEKVRLWLDQWPEVMADDPTEPAFVGEESGLLAADFTFREGAADEAALLQDWDTEACHEAAQLYFGESLAADYAEYFRRGRHFEPGHDRFWVAVNPQSEWAGVIWGRIWAGERADASVVEVQLWFVDPEYRGLGVGSRLLETLRAGHGPTPAVVVATLAADRRVEGPLGRAGFRQTGKFWMTPGS